MISIRTRAGVFAAFTFVFALLLHTPPVSSGIFSPTWASTKKLIAARFPDATQLSTTEFAAWLADKERAEKPVVIDTRAAEEFAISHLAGATNAATLQDAERVLKVRAKNTPIVVYCSVGYRSSELAVKLTKMGYTNVQNLEGSIFQWANEGRTVYKGDVVASKVHPYNAWWGGLLERKYWSHEP